jgi:hypothetical protein
VSLDSGLAYFLGTQETEGIMKAEIWSRDQDGDDGAGLFFALESDAQVLEEQADPFSDLFLVDLVVSTLRVLPERDKILYPHQLQVP